MGSAVTFLHVAISLVAIVAGFAVARGLLTGIALQRWSDAFMISTGVTLATGFLFPFNGMTPAIAIGILCVLIFLPTTYALYRAAPTRLWRLVAAAGTMLLFYFNALVLIVQSFQKVPFLNAVAPRGDEMPVVAAQVALLVAFLVCGVLTFRRSARM